MIQFYIPDIKLLHELPEAESAHCVRVLRKQAGDEIVCVDGQGCRYRCRITDAHPKRCGIEVLSCEDVPHQWGVNIMLCFAPTKNLDRIEWMAEKCTELGIDSFLPVECRYSERRTLKTERLNKILVSAMKQSLKALLPRLYELTPLQRVLTDIDGVIGREFRGQKFICYCSDEVERHDLVKEYRAGEDVAILIGPEGDFSSQEIETALAHGWMPVTLGKSRLRTETAALAAVAFVHCINQMHVS